MGDKDDTTQAGFGGGHEQAPDFAFHDQLARPLPSEPTLAGFEPGKFSHDAESAFDFRYTTHFAPKPMSNHITPLAMGHMAPTLPEIFHGYPIAPAARSLQQTAMNYAVRPPVHHGQQFVPEEQQIQFFAQYQQPYGAGYIAMHNAQPYSHTALPTHVFGGYQASQAPPNPQMYHAHPNVSQWTSPMAFPQPQPPLHGQSQTTGSRSVRPISLVLPQNATHMQRAGQYPMNYEKPPDLSVAAAKSTREARYSAPSVAIAGSRTDAQSSIPRGPPRKPRQSGFALWVGNLPSRSTILDLKDHFSTHATKDIESLKLISTSNCAFVNYRTQAACAAAMVRFHDSRFHDTRLVCRMRRVSAASTPVPLLGDPASETRQGEAVQVVLSDEDMSPARPAGVRVPERFFILKSLTLQDLEVSRRSGRWATQAHNEQALSAAFESTDNVYLIFSANKSGEYFGYARMYSPIAAANPEDESAKSGAQASAKIESTLSLFESANLSKVKDQGPKTIRTAATAWAPKGKIVDDLARGIIFWEADVDDADPELTEDGAKPIDAPGEHVNSVQSPESVPENRPLPANSGKLIDSASMAEMSPTSDVDAYSLSSGNSFQIDWLSTKKVPFYKTRGLRNAWNSNREVKIARDGTELETEVGKKLLGLFGTPGPSRAAQFQ